MVEKLLPSFSRHPFRLGIGAGILLGIGALAGIGLAYWLSPLSRMETSLQAVASSGGDTMAIATGQVDVGIEGLFILDFISGQLTCQILNPRTGTLGLFYTRNIAGDLGIEQGKQPKYLLITGALQAKQMVSNIRPADCLVYVADVNTGRYVAYMLPFNKQILEMNVQQVSTMIPVGGGSARNIVVE